MEEINNTNRVLEEMPMWEFVRLFSKQLAAVAVKMDYNCGSTYGYQETVYQLTLTAVKN